LAKKIQKDIKRWYIKTNSTEDQEMSTTNPNYPINTKMSRRKRKKESQEQERE
jgi:hypothetical protein